MNNIPRLLQTLFFPCTLLILWELWTFLTESTRALVLPAPSRIAETMLQIVGSQEWWQTALRTFGVTTLGFALGSVAAIGIGIALGQSNLATRLVNPTLLGLRSLPVVLYVPVALVLFEAGLQIPVVLSALVTTLYCAPPVAKAVYDFDLEKRRFLEARGIAGVRFYLGFMLPEIISAVFLSLSLAITLSLAVTVVAEILLPSLNGLGSDIFHAREMNQYVRLWALTGLLALAGLLFHNLILWCWRFAAPWLHQQQSD